MTTLLDETTTETDIEPIHVALGIPLGGPLAYRDSTSASHLSTVPGGRVQSVTQLISEGSGANFSKTWAAALDGRDEGLWTHYGMIHSDVAPPDGWLEIYYREMVAKGLHLISGCIPLKDFSGLVSTFIGFRDNRWLCRKLHYTDLHRLPTTFTTEDVAENDNELLYINNGLWLCDLRQPWCDEWDFQGELKRFKDPKTGKRQSWFRSEDCEMSRFMDERGVRYAATTAVDVGHWGYHCFRVPRKPEVPECK